MAQTTKIVLRDYLDAVMDMRALLDAETKWHKGFRGLTCFKRRLDDALNVATSGMSFQDYSAVGEIVRKEIRELFPTRPVYLGMFNDYRDTTYSDVCLVLDAAETQLRLDLEE